MRKPIQIVESIVPGTGSITTALCDDGTIWYIGPKCDGWTKVIDIPQEAPLE